MQSYDAMGVYGEFILNEQYLNEVGYTKTTAEVYRASPSEGYENHYQEIRETRDYGLPSVSLATLSSQSCLIVRLSQ